MPIRHPVKALFYAPPGTGKSVFASRFPKPFFICTDGNYEWLLDFGADPNAHADISSYAEFEKLALTSDFDGYDTVVVDLIEDIYKWNESEYCKKMKVDHLSDAGGYGKGWDITRTRLFVACAKLISLPKNIIFLSHESSYTKKDRRGNETTNYTPSNMMSEKFLMMLEGRLRYVLRAKFQDEVTPEGKVITHRVLSLIPKSDEYGIIRGVDVNTMPEDIELDAPTFLKCIGYDETSHAEPANAATPAPAQKTEPEEQTAPEAKQEEVQKVEQTEPSEDDAKPEEKPVAQPEKHDAQPIVTEKTEQPAQNSDRLSRLAAIRAKLAAKGIKTVATTEQPKAEVQPPVESAIEGEEETNAEEQKPEVKVVQEVIPVQTVKPSLVPESQADKLAAIKAKLAKLKQEKGGK